MQLANQAANPAVWPTPTVHGNHNRAGLSPKSGDGLATAVKLWPTPRATDHGSGSTREDWSWDTDRTATRTSGTKVQIGLGMAVNRADSTCSARPSVEPSGSETPPMTLNPAWCEWLMGFPIGWTDLGGSGTP